MKIDLCIVALALSMLACPLAPGATHPTARAVPAPAAAPLQSPLRSASQPASQHSRTLEFDLNAYRQLKDRPHIVLEQFPMASGQPITLDLQPLSIFAPNAQIVSARIENGQLIQQQLPTPDVLLLTGQVAGEPDSRVFLSLSPQAQHGYIRRGESLNIISSGKPGSNAAPIIADRQALAFDPANAAGFCETDLLPENQKFELPQTPMQSALAGGPPPCRQIQIAVETDAEYLANLFDGNQHAASAYVATLMGASSSIYIEDVNTRFQITFLRLWTDADPWDGGGTGAQLQQYRDYWNQNMDAVPRTLGHFLSGRALGGGVAYLGALCHGSLGYGLSANLAGTFPNPLQSNNNGNWDIMVVSHEIGHNFGSPHTHSYVPPIDGCGNGDCANANLGTIMSYCHTCAGGMTNIVLDLHPTVCGVILNYLDGLQDCNLDGSGMNPYAAPDYVTIGQGSQVTIDVLGNDIAANCKAIELYNFNATSNGGGTIELSPGTGPDGRDELIYQPSTLFLGIDRFSYNIQDSEKLFGGALVNVEIILVQPASFPSHIQPGLKAQYFALPDPQVLPDFSQFTPIAAETVADVDYPSTGGIFAGSGLSDNVGAVFTGYVSVPAASSYTFSIESDDGSKLYINDALLVNNDGLHGMVNQSGTVGLAAGLHKLRIEFFERGGGAGLILRYAGGGLSQQVVAPSALFRTIPADIDESGSIDVDDLLNVINSWGACPAPIAACAGDVNGDGNVDVDDLLMVINSWG